MTAEFEGKKTCLMVKCAIIRETGLIQLGKIGCQCSACTHMIVVALIPGLEHWP